VGLAPSQFALDTQETAGHVQPRSGVEVVAVTPELPEGDPLGVTEELGGLGVGRRNATLERGDPESHREAGAVRPELAAGGRGCHRRSVLRG